MVKRRPDLFCKSFRLRKPPYIQFRCDLHISLVLHENNELKNVSQNPIELT